MGINVRLRLKVGINLKLVIALTSTALLLGGFLSAAHAQEITHASWYGPGFHGKKTASGEIFNQNAMTAAHKTRKLGSMVKVTNISTGRFVVVKINDRGPYIKGRGIDLSKAAASALGITGIGKVSVSSM